MSNYKNETDFKNLNKVKEITKDFPSFIKDYINSLVTSTTTSTRLGYAINIKSFLDYLVDNNSSLKSYKDITPKVFAAIRRVDIIEYISDTSSYIDLNGNSRVSKEHGTARKLTALRNLYQFLAVNHEYPDITENTAALVKMPKIREKDVIALEKDEIQAFLKAVTGWESYLESTNQKKALDYYLKTKYRDTAIMMLFLGTGMRISELVGINIGDLDLNHNAVRIIRKGEKEQSVYYNDRVKKALVDYIDIERVTLSQNAEDKTPLFYSLQKKRITNKSVGNLVKKYATVAVPNKHITPHKLRASYATQLYDASGDIFLVSDALGHSRLETSKKYVRSKQAARKIASEKTDDWL
ncbi:MAG: tyrosine-type recombinase/integrase [Lachnospiraceae bacterium]|nr:tyrosine-type recombinase/integrase [Lachnospiraceae bacterium]